jgi:hypothetical protein
MCGMLLCITEERRADVQGEDQVEGLGRGVVELTACRGPCGLDERMDRAEATKRCREFDDKDIEISQVDGGGLDGCAVVAKVGGNGHRKRRRTKGNPRHPQWPRRVRRRGRRRLSQVHRPASEPPPSVDLAVSRCDGVRPGLGMQSGAIVGFTHTVTGRNFDRLGTRRLRPRRRRVNRQQQAVQSFLVDWRGLPGPYA